MAPLRAALLLVVALACAGCQLQWVAPQGSTPLRYRDAVFASSQVTSDITYGSAVNLEKQTVVLKLDLYEPVGDVVRNRPAIIWAHGGWFAFGDKADGGSANSAAEALAHEGFVTASINYRLESPPCDASAPDKHCVDAIVQATEDAKTAVRFLKAHAMKFGIDPTRIAFAGSSAGAIMAMQVAYNTEEDPGAGVRAGVSISGANLLSHINAGDAPTLLIHSAGDTVVPYQWAVNTVTDARAAGLHADLTTYCGDEHVPYFDHFQSVNEQISNFLWWTMDLAHASGSTPPQAPGAAVAPGLVQPPAPIGTAPPTIPPTPTPVPTPHPGCILSTMTPSPVGSSGPALPSHPS